MRPNFLKPRVLKRRIWKTINIVSTFAIVLNASVLGAFVSTPTQATAAETGFFNPSTNASVSGTVTNPQNAYSENSVDATVAKGASWQYGTFGISAIPAGSVIDGITVQARARDLGANDLQVSLSKNGGSTWTTERELSNFSQNYSVRTTGDATTLWGTTWAISDFTNANFAVKVRNNSTSGGTRNVGLDVLQVKVHYTEPLVNVTNPSLGQSCGLDIALVIDSSGSINSTELNQMKTAYKGFVNAFLPGTPTQMSVTDFDTTASVEQIFTNSIPALETAIDGSVSGGSTNWEDGLIKAWSTFDPRPAKQNLLVFASDGNPNRKGTAGTSVSESEAVAAAVTQSNAIKTAGTRILALGIGDNLNIDNLKAISGSNVNTGVTSDVITTDFTSLAGTLATLANQLCGGKILVQKQFDTDGDGKVDIDGSQADPLLAGWTFDVNGSPSNPAAQTTTSTGSLEFGDILNGTYSVTETNQLPNTALVSAQCVNGTQPVGQFNPQTKAVEGIAMGSEQTVSCTFLNQVSKVKLTMYKKFDYNGDGIVDAFNPLDWTWDVVGGPQNNLPGDEHGIMLPAGTYTITEDAIPNYSAVWTCGDDTFGTGTSLTITLNPGRHMTCDFSNTANVFKLRVKKNLDTDGDGDTDIYHTTGWTWDIANGGQNLPLEEWQTLLAGTYTISEDQKPGYHAADLTCVEHGNNNFERSYGAVESAAINLTNGDQTCEFTNARDTGTLIVHKDVVNPDGGSVNDTHSFTARVDGANPKTIAEGTEATYSNLPTGTYTVTEDADGNYTFVSFNHDLDVNAPGAQVSITKGQTTHLTITNKQQKATITINKDVRNSQGADVSDNASFNVTSNAGNFSISESAPKVLQVNPGSYTFTESNPSNYTVHSTNPKTLTVTSNGNASYTFENWQKTGRITGMKFEDKNGNGVRNQGEFGLDDWKIYLDLNGNSQYDNGEPYDWTDNDGDYSITNVMPGTYTVREVQQNGWIQTAPQGGSYTVTVGVNQTVSGKDFGNFKLGKIWGYKYDTSEHKLDGWTICLNGETCVVTGAGQWPLGYYEFTGLTAGNYTVTEQLVEGWFAVNPLYGHQVNVTSGTNTQKNFVNFEGFDLTVTKLMDADGKTNTIGDRTPTAGWTMELWKNNVKIDTKVTGEDGTYTWTNLGPGEYRVIEKYNHDQFQALLSDNITVPNWNDDDSSKDEAEFDAVTGTDVQVTFVNWQRSPVKIVAQKIVCQNEASLPNWGLGGPNISATTAQNFVNQSEGACWFAPDWNFQWGYDWIANPGDNTGLAQNWTTFGPTDQTGTAVTEITSLEESKIWLRESWNDLYIPFTYGESGNRNNVSAEFYCHQDVLNYDNYEWIDNLELSKDGNQPTYYCVAFNVRQTGTVTFDKVVVGGEAKDSAFTFTVNETSYKDGDGATLPTGTYNVTESGPAGYTLVSASGVCSKGEEGNIILNVTKEGGTCTLQNNFPELTIAKTASPAVVNGNQDVTYTITWSVAAESAPATNVVVTDPIPAQTSFVSMTCGTTTGTCTPSQTGTPVSSVSWNLGNRNPGESGTLTLVVKTAISVPNGSVIPNTASIRSEEIDPVFAQANVTATTAPQLQITKTVNATFVNPGDPITYTVKVKNIGTDTAVNVTLTDTLPAGFTFVDGGLSTKTFALGNLAVGEEKTTTYPVNVGTGVTAGSYDNKAKAKADNAAEVQTKVAVEVRIPRVLGETTSPVLQLKKTVSKAVVAPGATVTYTVEIKNTGTGEAVNLVLQDVLPLGFTFKGSTDSSKNWTLGNLAAGATKTVTYDVVVGKAVPNGSYENLAIAGADNHGKVTTSVPVQVKRGRVLGETLASTGVSLADLMVAVAGAGLVSFGVYLMRRRKEDANA